MSLRMKIVNFLLGALLLLLVMYGIETSRADPHPHDGGGVDAGETIIVETVIPGGSSRGYAVSGGDMDINDCLATESYLFGLYQRTKPNYLCMADKAQARGELIRAAEFRCVYWGVRRAQGGKKDCIERLTYDNPRPPLPPPTGSQRPDTDEDDDARYAEQQEEIEYLREENASIVGQIEYITQQIERAPAPQVQQIDKGAERRANSRAAYEKVLAEGTENND